MSDQIFPIFVGVGLVVIGVLLVVYEFLWWLKLTKLRWPLAIIGFLFEMVMTGIGTYILMRFLDSLGCALWIC